MTSEKTDPPSNRDTISQGNDPSSKPSVKTLQTKVTQSSSARGSGPRRPTTLTRTADSAQVRTFQLLPRQAYRLTLPDGDVFLPARTSDPTVVWNPVNSMISDGVSAIDSTTHEVVTGSSQDHMAGTTAEWNVGVEHVEHVEHTENLERPTDLKYPPEQGSGSVTIAAPPQNSSAGREAVLPAKLSHKLEQLQVKYTHPLYHDSDFNSLPTPEETLEARIDLEFLLNADNPDDQIQAALNAPENDITIISIANRFYPVIKGDLQKSAVFIARKQYLQELCSNGKYDTTFQRPIRRCIGGTDTLKNMFIDMFLYTNGLIPQNVKLDGSQMGNIDILVWLWGSGFWDLLLNGFTGSIPNQSLVLGEQQFELALWHMARQFRLLRKDPADIHNRCNGADVIAYSTAFSAEIVPLNIDDTLWKVGGFFEPSYYIRREALQHSAEEHHTRLTKLHENWKVYHLALMQYMEGSVPVDAFDHAPEEDIITKVYEMEKEFQEQLDWAESVDNEDPFHVQHVSEESDLGTSPGDEQDLVGMDEVALMPRTFWAWYGLDPEE